MRPYSIFAMIRIKSAKVLLVAPDVLSVEVLSSNKQIKHLTSAKSIFPVIYDMKPNLVVFDYDYLSKDIEGILRRMRANAFYDKIKICCYKTKSNTKIDSLLKTIGVNYVICKEDFVENTPAKALSKSLTDLIDRSFMHPTPAMAY